MTAVPDLMVTLATGTQVPWSEFKTWSPQKQARNLATVKVSEQGRAKMSAASKGRPKSAETRARMSASRFGLHKSYDTRAKIRTANLGKTLYDETRAKIREANRGRPASEEQRAKMRAWHQANPRTSNANPIMTPTGQFPSRLEAARWAEQNGLVNARNKIDKWLKTHPDQFYYVPKDTK
jgi:hypothetical protein